MIPYPAYKLLEHLIDLYILILLVEVVLSWIPNVPRYHWAVQLVHRLTEPVLRPLRKLVPPEKLGYLDISPVIAVMLLTFLKRILQSLTGVG